jgi:hypothetical protein
MPPAPWAGSETAKQLPGERLGVVARDCETEQIFKEFIILQPLTIAGERALAKPCAMAGGVRRGIAVAHIAVTYSFRSRPFMPHPQAPVAGRR